MWPYVALMVETSQFYGRQILRGITRYLRSHSPWSIFLECHEWEAKNPAWLKDWRGNGLITRTADAALADLFRKRRIPIINLNDRFDDLGLPMIESDHRAIARLAAEHLLERGFHHFAVCGFSGHAWSRTRMEGFVEAVGAAGSTCQVYESLWSGSRTNPWEQEQSRIGDWLRDLPRPVGIFTCNDSRGQHVLDACQRIGLSVPEEAAVIGVGDDTLLCELCNPPLSSVVSNPERIGYEAAALLDRLMAGEKPKNTHWLIEPLRVTTRQSTDVLAIDDRDVALAVRYIRENACRGATVGDVLAQVPLSRTLLERRFRKYLGRSPQAEIRTVQLKCAKQLLVETDLSLERIAELVGYEYPGYLSVVFKREIGLTPSRYRRQAQTGEPPSAANPKKGKS